MPNVIRRPATRHCWMHCGGPGWSGTKVRWSEVPMVPYRQSERMSIHADVAARLREAVRLTATAVRRSLRRAGDRQVSTPG